MSSGAPTTKQVREYLMDMPQHNFKYDDEFFTDRNIGHAITWTGERFEAITPLNDNYSASQLPKYVWLIGIISQLFEQRYINATINYNPSLTENGLNIPVGDDAQVFLNISRFYEAKFVDMCSKIKKGEDIKQSLTSIRSPYSTSSRWPV